MSESKEEMLQRVLERLQGETPASRDPDGMYFSSARDAEVSICDPRKRTSRYLREVAEYVADDDNDVRGSGSEFHNLATEYRRAFDNRSALLVARRGLKLHPSNTSLLGVAISAATDGGDYAAGEELVAYASEIDWELWTAKLFAGVIGYYQERMGNLDEAGERALEVSTAFEERYPFDDTAYNKHAQVLISLGRVDEASSLLQKVIFGTNGPDGNLQEPISAPRCCLTYIDQILDGKSGRASYDDIIRVARKGVQFTAAEQPGASIGYFMYRDAEAQDALICSAKDAKDGFGNEARVREALQTYQCAYQLLSDSDYLGTIRERYLILTTKSGITDLPLEK